MHKLLRKYFSFQYLHDPKAHKIYFSYANLEISLQLKQLAAWFLSRRPCFIAG